MWIYIEKLLNIFKTKILRTHSQSSSFTLQTLLTHSQSFTILIMFFILGISFLIWERWKKSWLINSKMWAIIKSKREAVGHNKVHNVGLCSIHLWAVHLGSSHERDIRLLPNVALSSLSLFSPPSLRSFQIKFGKRRNWKQWKNFSKLLICGKWIKIRERTFASYPFVFQAEWSEGGRSKNFQ